MKRKLQLHRETLRNLAGAELSGAQGAAGGIVTGNPQSCIYVCQIPTETIPCTQTILITKCIRCPVAGTNPCL